MNAAIRHDLTELVKRWDADNDAMRLEQWKFPMNHTYWRIYAGMLNQQVANLGEVIALMKKHDGIDQCEQALSDALVENDSLKRAIAKMAGRTT